MAVFKCKMCSGTLDITAGATVVQCDYCGTTQTVPSADDEKKISLFARANRLRAGNEFDKAFGIYESIIADFPEEAEAYWGLVLCKYGVEYVDDPATGKKIPTCHRSSFESVMDDNNFELTLEYADMIAKKIYREEAKQLEEIRKGIIEVSSKEEPYDIFICYKETDENGNRTIDSVLAQDIYDMLTAKGYRTFFARITLEDKLGQEYEPYIFAALNTAKIMLAVGTSFEHYDAVWVKNEWSRFLKLMAADKSKHLIPCFKNLDAYDMPKEFAKLQAQDMSKLGWEQDLARGIQKLHPLNTAPAPISAPTPSTATTDTLLKRAFMFAGDGEFDKADQYIEKVLDIDPENASAYLCKLMTAFHVKQESDLGAVSSRLDLNPAYNKIMQYGDAPLRKRIEGYNQTVVARIGKRNAQLQELESKKLAVLDTVAKSELALMTAQGKCDSIAQRINQRSSNLNELRNTITKLKNKLSACQEVSKAKYVPIWVLIPLMLITFVAGLLLLNLFGEDGFVVVVIAVSALLSAGLFVLSFGRASQNFIKGAFFAVAIAALIFAVTTFFGLWIEHGGPFEVIGVLVENILFAIFGDHTDVFTPTVWSFSFFFWGFGCYISGIVFAVVHRKIYRKNKKQVKTLTAEIEQKTAEYNAKVNGDVELVRLEEEHAAAKAEYNLVFNECEQKIRDINMEYLRTASAYGLHAEALVPEKYKSRR